MFQFQVQRARSAFTLIELLVVIAIIAILAAILFPVFARARENARRSSCQSNLKQIALGVKQYTQDYDERFPNITVPAPAGSPGWAYAIQPYLKSEQIFQCPSETAPPPPGTDLLTRAGTNGFSDYYLNYNTVSVADPAANPVVGTGRSEASIDYSSNTIMNGEGTGISGDATANSYQLSPPGAGRARHLEGANYSFVDGHVKWMRPERALGASNATDCGPTGANTPTGSNATFCIN